MDTFSRYVPVLDARYSYRGEDVVATLDRVSERLVAELPRQKAGTAIVSDQPGAQQ